VYDGADERGESVDGVGEEGGERWWGVAERRAGWGQGRGGEAPGGERGWGRWGFVPGGEFEFGATSGERSGEGMARREGGRGPHISTAGDGEGVEGVTEGI
jgi:hypothetical protein